MAATFTSHPITPIRLVQVRSLMADALRHAHTPEAREALLTAYRTEIIARVDHSRPVPAPLVNPRYARARYEAMLLSRKADALHGTPEFEAADEAARDAWYEFDTGWCHCDGPCECDHP